MSSLLEKSKMGKTVGCGVVWGWMAPELKANCPKCGRRLRAEVKEVPLWPGQIEAERVKESRKGGTYHGGSNFGNPVRKNAARSFRE